MTQPQHGGPALPERIAGLAAVASNLSWSWNRNARALFRSLDPALWRRTQHNPIELLRRVAPERLAACAADPEFLRLYDVVAAAVAQDATSAGTWFATAYPELVKRPIAYFCAEFGLHASVPIRDGISRARQAADRVLLRRVRAARLGANLFRRPRGPRRGPMQGGVGPGRPARGRRPVLYQGILGPTTAARRLAGGCRRAIRRRRNAAPAGAGAQGRSLPRNSATVRPLREHRRLARHGGSGADLPPGHGSRTERPGRPRAVPSALRRRAGPAAAARVGPRRRRRASVAGPGVRPGRLARERRTRRVHAGGARA